MKMPNNFWCHSCEKIVAVTENSDGDFSCNECGDFFVERMEESAPNSTQNDVQNPPPNPIQNSIPNVAQNSAQIPNDPFQTAILQMFDGINARRRRTEANIRTFRAGNGQFRINVVTYNGIPPQFMARNPDAMNETEFQQFLARMFEMNRAKGTPPASENAVSELQKGVFSESDGEGVCCVCQDAFTPGENIIHMPCKHFFHTDCLLPWLKLHNSCPECRFELKTDDKDYEAAKKTNNGQ